MSQDQYCGRRSTSIAFLPDLGWLRVHTIAKYRHIFPAHAQPGRARWRTSSRPAYHPGERTGRYHGHEKTGESLAASGHCASGVDLTRDLVVAREEPARVARIAREVILVKRV